MARNEYFTRARRPFWHEMNTLQGRRGHSAIKCIFYEGAAAIIARNEYFAREIEVAACKALLYSFPGSWVPHVFCSTLWGGPKIEGGRVYINKKQR